MWPSEFMVSPWGQNSGFDLLHSLKARKHCSTYNLLWKSMNSSCKICVAVLSRAQGLLREKKNGPFSAAIWPVGMEHYSTYNLV